MSKYLLKLQYGKKSIVHSATNSKVQSRPIRPIRPIRPPLTPCSSNCGDAVNQKRSSRRMALHNAEKYATNAQKIIDFEIVGQNYRKYLLLRIFNFSPIGVPY